MAARMTAENDWGRWGADDQRGAANLIDSASTMRGLAAVRSGSVLSLAVPLKGGRGPIAGRRAPLQHFMMRDGGDYAAGLKERGFGFADDALVMSSHGTTHIDALSHIWVDHQMWNGFSADKVSSAGAAVCGIEQLGPVVTRGVLLDLAQPGGPSTHDEYQITASDLEEACSKNGLVPQPGDALLVRTGWLERWRRGAASEQRWAGLRVDCADWMHDRGFAVVGADNIAVEWGPTGDPHDAAPLHVAMLRNRGVYLMELLDLEDLAASGQGAFLLVLAPLRLVGGVGSPLNPVAVL